MANLAFQQDLILVPLLRDNFGKTDSKCFGEDRGTPTVPKLTQKEKRGLLTQKVYT